LKANYIGILGAVIAFVSLVLPWWSMTLSSSVVGASFSFDANLYLYQLANSVADFSLANSWYAWAALALVLIGAILALAGSLMEKGRMLLAGGGVLEIVAMVIFAVGLMTDLSGIAEFVGIGLFSNISVFGANVSTYLSYGFWLALVAAIMMFAASAWRPKETAPIPAAPVTTS